MQLYVDRARLDEVQPGGFDLLKGLVDVGDIVGATGTIKRTEKGELSVVATGIQVSRGGGAGSLSLSLPPHWDTGQWGGGCRVSLSLPPPSLGYRSVGGGVQGLSLSLSPNLWLISLPSFPLPSPLAIFADPSATPADFPTLPPSPPSPHLSTRPPRRC